MTVREWVEQRTPRPPAALVRRMLDFLGDDSSCDARNAAELLFAAATRALGNLVSERRFDRESALDLLAVDALTTYAFEHASAAATSERELLDFTRRGAQEIGRMAVHHV